MLEDTYEIKALAYKPLAAQELASRLLFRSPSRGWDNYGGLDDTLRIAISIAETHQDAGPGELISQYGTATIIPEMKSLRSALHVLATNGREGLSFQDKYALSMGKLTMDSLIRQTLIIAESNRPGRSSPTADGLITPGSEEYWERRVRQLTHTEYTHEDERSTYSSSKQFAGYLVDAQKVLSSLCYDLGIQEINSRQLK